jgi:hypothetical protein
VALAGRKSMIDKGRYEEFKASGKISIRDMVMAMKGYPSVKISRASLEFTPAYASLTDANLVAGKNSDFELNGKLNNYLPYFFRNQTLKGNMSLHSRLTDASEIMSEMESEPPAKKDTSSLSLVKIPKNIDLDFDAMIDEFRYGNIKGEKARGHLIVRNGVLSLRETGMNTMNGTLMMNADYDTRDTLKPVMKADMDMQNIGVKDAFSTFNTVKMMAPAAKGIDGKISVRIGFESLLGRNMMPLIKTINGEGKLKSDEITLVESATFNQVKEFLKLGDNYSNTFRNVNIIFKITDGRIFISPFDVKTGNLKMNISGDQGLDQTINYIVKTEIPRSDLGNSINSLIDNVSAQAAAFGIKFKPADILKINVKVSGTFTKPVVAPYFGSTTGSGPVPVQETAKETIKQTIDNSTDKAKEKLREEAATQGDKLIKEAETRGQQLRDEAGKAAQKLRQEADSSAAKLIKSAEPKGVLYKAGAQKGADALKKEAEKRGNQLILEADKQSKKLLDDAKAKKEEMLKKI